MKPYKASISIGKLNTAFYRQNNESSNAVFSLATDKLTSNTNSITFKNSIPNDGSITKSIHKVETKTSPLINTAIKNNIINGITGTINDKIEIDKTSFYNDYSTYGNKSDVSFGGPQKPISIDINKTKESILQFTYDTFNKPEVSSKVLRIVRYNSIGQSGVFVDPYHNTCPECPLCSPDPGLLGQIYIYNESGEWVLYP